MNPYEVLGVDPDAEQGALRDAYRRLVRLHHPDLATNHERRELSNAQMQRINQAWQMVGDPEKRAGYDDRCAETKHEEARLEAARRDLKLAREQVQKTRVAAKKKATQSKSKSSVSKTIKTPLKAAPAHVAISPTRQKIKKLKKARSPEEIRVRNQQKLLEATQYWKAGKRTDAIASCQSVLRNDFRNVAAREILGDIYLEMGERAKALILFEQAFALQKGSLNIKRKISDIKEQANMGDFESVGQSQNDVDLRFQSESIQVAPVNNLDSSEMIQDVSFWQRLRNKLGNRR